MKKIVRGENNWSDNMLILSLENNDSIIWTYSSVEEAAKAIDIFYQTKRFV